MGSRSGTGFAPLLGRPKRRAPAPHEDYQNEEAPSSYIEELSMKLEKKKGEGTAADVLELLSKSLPAFKQLYASYAGFWVSVAACNDYKRREKENFKRRIQEEKKVMTDSLVGSLARNFVDEKVAEFMMKEKSPLDQNQINLTKKVAHEALVMEIQEEIEEWFNE